MSYLCLLKHEKTALVLRCEGIDYNYVNIFFSNFLIACSPESTFHITGYIWWNQGWFDVCCQKTFRQGRRYEEWKDYFDDDKTKGQ